MIIKYDLNYRVLLMIIIIVKIDLTNVHVHFSPSLMQPIPLVVYSGLISGVTLKCGHLANQATMCVPKGGWNSGYIYTCTCLHHYVHVA